MANEQNLIPFTGADDPRRANGPPKGTKHISTHIQEMLNDPSFELKLKDGTLLKERPIQAIIKTAVAKSISGDNRWAEWLAKHGYGEKLQIEVEDKRKEVLARYLGADSNEAKDASIPDAT